MFAFREMLADALPHDPTSRRGFLALGAVLLLILAGLVIALSVWQVLAVATSLVAFFIALRRPRWVLLFLAVWIPLEPFLLKFISDDIYIYARYFSEGLIYLLAGIVLARAVLGEKHFKQTPIDLPFVLFLLVLAASAVLNTVPLGTALLGARQIVRFIILFFVVVYLYPPREFARTLLLAMFGMVIFQSVLGAVQAAVGAPLDEFLIPSERRFFESIQLTPGITQFWDPGSRIFGTMGRYDQLGTFLTFFLLCAIGLLYSRGFSERKRILFGALLVGLPALLLTYSRASWFGLLIGVILIGAWLFRDRRVLAGFGVFLVMLFGYLLYSGIVVPTLTEESGRQTVAERFFEAFSYERWRGEYFGLGRLYWMAETPRVVVAAAPLFGVGPGQYGGGAVAALGNTTAYSKLGLPFGVYGTEGYIDNNWFSLWGETGSIGFVLYLWMYVALWLSVLRIFRDTTDPFVRGLSAGLLGAMLAITLQAFLGTYLEMRTLALYLWMIAGCVVALGRRERLV